MRVGTPGFVATRLTEAREARGLAQTALSELTGIKSQSISHYEQGRQSPSPDALVLLCEKLELPERYFLKPAPHQGTRSLFFRSYRPTTRIARMKSERRLGWLKEIASYLRGHIDLPACSVPQFPVSPTEPHNEEIESVAERCREQLHLGYGPLPRMVELLESLGCVVSIGATEDDDECACSQWDEDVPYVMLARGCSDRTRFDAAHELGHQIMHRGEEPEAADPETQRILQQQADHFARAFLLPSRAFSREVWAPTIDVLMSLRKQWICPITAMVARCGELGVFDEDHARRVLVNFARRGLKSGEAADQAMGNESPQLLARGIRLLIEEGVRDRHGLLTDLSLSAMDIEELAGLPANYLSDRTVTPPPALRLRAESVRA